MWTIGSFIGDWITTFGTGNNRHKNDIYLSTGQKNQGMSLDRRSRV